MNRNRIGVGFGLLVMLAGLSQGQWVQWTTAMGGNDQWYKLTDRASSWDLGELQAIGDGGHLASIHSAAENTFLVTTFIVGDLEHRPVWIGINDAASEGTFSWSDSTPVDYANWQPGEPNNDQGNEDFGCINWHNAFQSSPHDTWNDAPIGGTSGYAGTTDGPYFGIVKSAAPTPGSAMLIGAAGVLVGRRRR